MTQSTQDGTSTPDRTETGGPRIFAVIPVHNRVDQTLRCLRSLSTGTVTATAVVVDDGSTDGTAWAVAHAHPDAVVLRGDGDLWWAGATNLGVEHALANGADYVLTLNNDGVLAPTALEVLLDLERTDGPALRCSQRHHLDRPDHVSSVGRVMDWTLPRGYRRATPGGDEPIRVDAAGANAMLVPRRCFDEIGPFDAEHFPQCWSDWDFQLRAKAAGWSLYTVPASVVLEDQATVGPRLASETNLADAVRLVMSRRSPYHPAFTWRFYRRHAPPGRAVVYVFGRYKGLVKTVVRHHLRRRSRLPATAR
jgi:GT2 family glycosyltransferase